MFCKYEVIGSSPIVSICIQIGTLDRNPKAPPADGRRTCYNGRDKEPRPRGQANPQRRLWPEDTAGAACCLSVCHAHNTEFIETGHTRHECENFDIRTSEHALPLNLTSLFISAGHESRNAVSPSACLPAKKLP